MKNIIQIFTIFFYFSFIVPFATQKFNKDLMSFKYSERNNVKHSPSYRDNFIKAIPTTLMGISVSWMLQNLGVSAETLPSTTSEVSHGGFCCRPTAQIIVACFFGLFMIIVICCCCKNRINKCVNGLTPWKHSTHIKSPPPLD